MDAGETTPTRSRPDRTSRPSPLRTDGSNVFAHHSMARRVPNIIADVIARNADYPESIKAALESLREDIAGDGPIRLFAPPAPDHDLWRGLIGPHVGSSWLDSEWFFAEMLAYRWILAAARYWDTLRDPFAPFKDEEMGSDALWSVLGEALAIEGSPEERLDAHLRLMLWSNRIDLSLSAVASKGTSAAAEHLLTDDIPQSVEHLISRRPADVHIVMDNAGTEQAMDYAIADLLLTEKVAERVTLHVKMQPVLVSDVIVSDIYALLERMSRRGGAFAVLEGRIRAELADGRLRIVPDFFWNTPGCWWELPQRLQEPLRRADLVVAKGDVNYRRITNDALWPDDATVAEALFDVDLTMLALRTLKSDTLVGVGSETIRRLDRTEGSGWRSSGDYGVAQFHHP